MRYFPLSFRAYISKAQTLWNFFSILNRFSKSGNFSCNLDIHEIHSVACCPVVRGPPVSPWGSTSFEWKFDKMDLEYFFYGFHVFPHGASCMLVSQFQKNIRKFSFPRKSQRDSVNRCLHAWWAPGGYAWWGVCCMLYAECCMLRGMRYAVCDMMYAWWGVRLGDPGGSAGDASTATALLRGGERRRRGPGPPPPRDGRDRCAHCAMKGGTEKYPRFTKLATFFFKWKT